MKPRQFFPLGKAYGNAFCNRTEENKRLIGNIENCKHTFLIAPRRYGKSSLCEKAFESISISHSQLDFHLALSQKDVETIIINGIVSLIGTAIGPAEKLTSIIKRYTKKLQPKFSIGTTGFKLELDLTLDSLPSETIAEALLLLDHLLKEKQKQAVLLLDEFQEIGNIEGGRAIEGAIRHAAQELQNLALIFSGSNPHLLKNMFEDERRPLYKLCRRIKLDRIAEAHYKTHLNKAAKALWGQNLTDNTFQQIMLVTECHPYYVNYLCDELWSSADSLPTDDNVNQAWNLVVEEERSDLIKDFSTLTDNQKKLMIYIANHGGTDIYSGEAAKKMGITSGSISRTLSALLENDYLEKIGGSYRLVVPAYKNLLKKPA